MKKIALIGAPTSGKTALAQQIKEALSERKVAIVDNYIRDIEERSDNTLAHFATYVGNVQVAIGRWEAERKALRDEEPDVLVTCGSIVETTVYNGIQALLSARLRDNPWSIRTLQNDKRSSVSMTFLGILGFDTWDYDHAFYLPVKSEDDWIQVVSDHIPDAAEALMAQITRLSEDRGEWIGRVLQEVMNDGDGEGGADEENQ